MRLLLIRHGDPDYINDSLTARGEEEAKALRALIPSLNVGDCYVSPLGRARRTAELALSGTGIIPSELDWIQEFMTEYNVNGSEELRKEFRQIFPNTRLLTQNRERRNILTDDYASIGTLVNPGTRKAFAPDKEGRLPKYEPRVPWDMLPGYYTSHPELSDPREWRQSFVATHGGDMPGDGREDSCHQSTFLACYDYVTDRFDRFLEGYGYRREAGGLYRTGCGTEKTVTFFCHFGITAVLLSRLWDTSPFLLLQSLCMAPTSVTEVVTEERVEGYAYFRALRIGDTTHLTLKGQEASFAARFCETYHNLDQRH